MEPPHQKSLHCYMYYQFGRWTIPRKDRSTNISHAMNPKKKTIFEQIIFRHLVQVIRTCMILNLRDDV